ncbi:TerD family protein [Nocardia asteroides]|uniref:TerD family protein n=1 Tax=Nocardia asteroides TaxID=1824 RepID=UPI001E509354|nr:TerD family protein [Nocardia asteroides]UGT63826.1 tellurium resistance TerZ family protein [Nocardia asteroides]
MTMQLTDRGGAAQYLKMAVGWDPVRRARFGSRSRDIDLNAAALLYADRTLVDAVYHEQLTSTDGAVRHHGDSTTGEGKGDNEVITIDLTRLGAHVDAIALLVTCYTGQSFPEIENAFCRLLDGATDRELTRYDLSAAGPVSGLLMGVLHRSGSAWEYRGRELPLNAKHPVEAVPAITAQLG